MGAVMIRIFLPLFLIDRREPRIDEALAPR